MEEKVIQEYPTYSITSTGLIRDLRSGQLHDGYFAQGYRRITLVNPSGKNSFLIHRLVAQAFILPVEGKTEIDHINRDTQDNRVENLRWADDFIQSQNRGIMKTNASGHKNISLDNGSYRLTIVRNKTIVCKKRFSNLEDAVAYRRRFNL